ncbi:DNA-processing protein DprA [Actinomyces faecalis]|uniref:DNA-processing protein DprA n=2 Tax=Actinomyces faecalis TaxID=2722820 RepID=UPI001553820F|nr:DNA-processing protein DprA [Actinomyces faecalis]
MESTESLAYVLALTRTKRRGLTQGERVQDLLAERDPQAVYDRHRYEAGDMLRGAAGDELLDQARRDIDTWANAGYGIVSVLSDRYPTRVREVHEAPALLYYQGALLSDDDGVCVVGSRQALPRNSDEQISSVAPC